LDSTELDVTYVRTIVKITPFAGKYRGVQVYFCFDLDMIYCTIPELTQRVDGILSPNPLKYALKMVYQRDNMQDDMFSCPQVHQHDTKPIERKDVRIVHFRLLESEIRHLYLEIPSKMPFFEVKFLLSQYFQKEFEIYHFCGKYVEEDKFLCSKFDIHFKLENCDDLRHRRLLISCGQQKFMENVDLQLTLKEFDCILREKHKFREDAFIFMSQVKGLARYMSHNTYRDKKVTFDMTIRNFPRVRGSTRIEDVYKDIPLYEMTLEALGFGQIDCLDVFEVTGPSIEKVPIGTFDTNPNWSRMELLKYMNHLQGKFLTVIPEQ